MQASGRSRARGRKGRVGWLCWTGSSSYVSNIIISAGVGGACGFIALVHAITDNSRMVRAQVPRQSGVILVGDANCFAIQFTIHPKTTRSSIPERNLNLLLILFIVLAGKFPKLLATIVRSWKWDNDNAAMIIVRRHLPPCYLEYFLVPVAAAAKTPRRPGPLLCTSLKTRKYSSSTNNLNRIPVFNRIFLMLRLGPGKCPSSMISAYSTVFLSLRL